MEGGREGTRRGEHARKSSGRHSLVYPKYRRKKGRNAKKEETQRKKKK